MSLLLFLWKLSGIKWYQNIYFLLCIICTCKIVGYFYHYRSVTIMNLSCYFDINLHCLPLFSILANYPLPSAPWQANPQWFEAPHKEKPPKGKTSNDLTGPVGLDQGLGGISYFGAAFDVKWHLSRAFHYSCWCHWGCTSTEWDMAFGDSISFRESSVSIKQRKWNADIKQKGYK